MLLAKVYLNAEVYTGTPQYAAAMTETQAVIAGPYSLDGTWIRLFRTDNKNSPEVIFPIIQDGQTTRTWGGMTFLVHAGCGGNQMPGGDYGIDGCWWGYRMKPEAFNRYGAGDNRTSFFWDGGSPMLEQQVVGKVLQIGGRRFRFLVHERLAGIGKVPRREFEGG